MSTNTCEGSKLLRCTTVAICAGVTSLASGSIIDYTSQSRGVSVAVEDRLNGYSESHVATAPNFGPFNQGVSASVPGGPGTASAYHNSILDPLAGIQVQVVVTALGSINFQQRGSGSSWFTVHFDITELCQATLTYSTFAGEFSLQGPGVSFNTVPDFGPATVTLMPGSYTMQAQADFSNGSSEGSGAFATVSLVIPSPGCACVLLLASATQRRSRRG